MEFCFVNKNIFYNYNNNLQRSCCEPEEKKEAEERIDDMFDNYLAYKSKEEEKQEKINKSSRSNRIICENLSNNNQIDNNTYENSKNNNICNNIINNNYYINSVNYNNCCGYYFKSNDKNPNDTYNNTQKYTLSLLKKKNNNSNKLKIKNLFGDLFKEKYIITINEFGIESFTPLRRQYDGVTKFGPIGYGNDGKPVNDFEIVIPEELKNDIETLFTIEYNNIKKKYILFSNCFNENQDLNLFIKLEIDFPISQKYKFSLGEVHFSVQPKPGGALELEMNMEDGEIESHLFGIAKEMVKIGRSKDCDIILKSLAYSRIQSCFYYKEEENIWYIQDGFDGKPSMNGTWLFINFPFEINNNIKLRDGKNLLELTLT